MPRAEAVTGAIGVKGTELPDWQHPARERIVTGSTPPASALFFVAERDLHSGTLRALRLPRSPTEGSRHRRRAQRRTARAGEHPAPEASSPARLMAAATASPGVSKPG